MLQLSCKHTAPFKRSNLQSGQQGLLGKASVPPLRWGSSLFRTRGQPACILALPIAPYPSHQDNLNLCRCSNSNQLFCFWKLSQISIMDFLNKINQDKEFQNSAYFSSPARSSVNLACEPCIVSAAFCPRHHNSKGLPSVKTPWRRERQSHSLAESVTEHHITSRGGGGAYGVIIERLQHKRELLWCSMWC